jgi:hypothetical protein
MEGDAIMNDIVYITRSDLNAAIADAAKKAADWLGCGVIRTVAVTLPPLLV